MPLFRKTLVKTGVYRAPQGEFRADRARLRRLVDNFHAMKAAGIRVPISWGHSPYANPASDRERHEQQFWFGAHNAGYLPDLNLTDKGEFDGIMDVPGVELDKDGDLVHWIKLPDGRQVRGKVGEVSIAVKPFTDGTGKDWGESLVHVALTPLPVAHGHGGFTASMSSVCKNDSGEYTLSLAQFTRTLAASEEAPVADDKEDKKPPFEKKEGTDDKGGGDSKDHFAEGMKILAARGIGLPDDTTAENFWERLCVAGHALEHAESETGEDLDDDGMDDGLEADTDEGVTVGDDGVVQEEPRPMMMSLASTKDRAAKAAVRRVEAEHKKSLLSRISRLEKRGLKPVLSAELRSAAEGYTLGYTLSNDGEMVVSPRRLDQRISDLEESLPAKHPLAGLRTAQVQRRPDERQAKDESSDEISKRAEAVSRK